MFLRSIWWEGTFSFVEPLLNWMYRMLLVSSCSEINTVKSTHFFTVFSPFTISTDKNFVGSPVWSLSRIKLCYFYMYNIAESFCDRPIFAKLCCWKKRSLFWLLKHISAIRQLSPLPVAGQQILTDIVLAPLVLSCESYRSFTFHTCCSMEHLFKRSHSKDRFPHHTAVFEPASHKDRQIFTSSNAIHNVHFLCILRSIALGSV